MCSIDCTTVWYHTTKNDNQSALLLSFFAIQKQRSNKLLPNCRMVGCACMGVFYILCVSALFVIKGTVHFVFHIMSLWFKYVEDTLFALIHKYDEYMNVFPNTHTHNTVYSV